MIICLDFDGVLHDAAHPLPLRRMGPPLDGANEAVHELQEHGHQLVVHSSRCTDETRVEHVLQWLAYWGFGYIPVSVTKPMADVYLDDKGLRHEDWDTSLTQLAIISGEIARQPKPKPRTVAPNPALRNRRGRGH